MVWLGGGVQALRTQRGLSGPHGGERGGRADIIEVVPKEASPGLELGAKRIKPGRSIPRYKVLNWVDMSVHVCK